MFKSQENDYGEDQAANLTLVGLLFLFAFVVLFVFIAMNTETTARSDLPSTAQYHAGQQSGNVR